MRRFFAHPAGVAAASAAIFAAGCSEGIKEARQPVPVYSGNSTCQPGEEFLGFMRNEGEGDLVVNAPTISGPPGLITLAGADFPATIAPGGSVTFSVTCGATTSAAQGRITFETNAGDPTVIPIGVTPGTAIAIVNPNPIDFGRVPAGMQGNVDVTVFNAGSSPLSVQNILLVATNTEFTIPEGALDVFTQVDEFGNSGLTLAPQGLEGDRFTFPMYYEPASDGFDSARLIVESNDPENPRLNIPIQANGAEPCIRVNHEDGYNFGERLLSQTAEEVFTITNCSDAENGEELEVSAIFLTEEFAETRDAFGVQFQSAWGDPVTWPVVLAPGETDSFVVTYLPESLETTDRAQLQIDSTDEYKSPLLIELTGTGSNNECPVAVASCRVSGPPSDELAVLPLDTITCTADGSSDPDGSIVVYQWEVLLAPSGSTSRFQSPSSDSTSFFVDVAGAYQFQLTVFDDRGAPACSPAIVDVVATPDQDIHVQLVWDTPGDPDRFDTGAGAGADLDLHFLHPNGAWCDRQWDCHFRNKTPNWGSLDASADDDPSLDFDRIDGWGPENVNMKNPENGVIYRIGVKYYNEHGYGYSDATIRLYLLGTLVWTQTRRLETSGYFWDAATLSWPLMEVVSIDRVTPNVPRPNTCLVGG